MKIVNSYPNPLSKKQQYDLTMSPKTQKMSDNEGCVLDVTAYAEYIDEDAGGNERKVLAILTPEGETMATNSDTFREDFFKMVDLFGPDGVTRIEVISGTSKAGRKFYTCAYAGE